MHPCDEVLISLLNTEHAIQFVPLLPTLTASIYVYDELQEAGKSEGFLRYLMVYMAFLRVDIKSMFGICSLPRKITEKMMWLLIITVFLLSYTIIWCQDQDLSHPVSP
jgi:hypothetical protein